MCILSCVGFRDRPLYLWAEGDKRFSKTSHFLSVVNGLWKQFFSGGVFLQTIFFFMSANNLFALSFIWKQFFQDFSFPFPLQKNNGPSLKSLFFSLVNALTLGTIFGIVPLAFWKTYHLIFYQ